MSGGTGNAASGFVSSVSGGYYNTAVGRWSTVSGGAGNTTSEPGATVSGERQHRRRLVRVGLRGQTGRATGFGSSVTGGVLNVASGDSSSVAGGTRNEASGVGSTVTGGIQNVASARAASGQRRRGPPSECSLQLAGRRLVPGELAAPSAVDLDPNTVKVVARAERVRNPIVAGYLACRGRCAAAHSAPARRARSRSMSSTARRPRAIGWRTLTCVALLVTLGAPRDARAESRRRARSRRELGRRGDGRGRSRQGHDRSDRRCRVGHAEWDGKSPGGGQGGNYGTPISIDTMSLWFNRYDGPREPFSWSRRFPADEVYFWWPQSIRSGPAMTYAAWLVSDAAIVGRTVTRWELPYDIRVQSGCLRPLCPVYGGGRAVGREALCRRDLGHRDPEHG